MLCQFLLTQREAWELRGEREEFEQWQVLDSY
jgi:hypothetical protein